MGDRSNIGTAHHVVDHALEAHLLAVLGRIEAGDAVVVQFADLRRHDHAAAAAKYLDVLAAALPQQVDMYLKYSTWPP